MKKSKSVEVYNGTPAWVYDIWEAIQTVILILFLISGPIALLAYFGMRSEQADEKTKLRLVMQHLNYSIQKVKEDEHWTLTDYNQQEHNMNGVIYYSLGR